MKYLVVSLIFSTIIANAYAWRFFYNGRINENILRQTQKLQDSAETPKNFTRWFTQNLDHFRSDSRTWNQRYYVNDEYFDKEKRNVAFLMIGGEGEATDVWMTNGQWVEYGKQFNAILFQLEHRFYGKSHPTEDLSVDNLEYLTSEQALTDLALFVASMNEEYKLSSDIKWIAFGGSYPGSLAAWARLKYPHLISGSVSTSGPLLAIPDFQAYFGVIADDLRLVDENCYTAVKEGTAQIELFLTDEAANSAKHWEPLPLGSLQGIAQYNKDNRLSTKGTLLGNITLNTICSIMTDPATKTEIQRLANFNSLMLEATDQKCLDFSYVNMILDMTKTTWNSSASEGGRQWMYQTCNEFGFFQTSDEKPQIFSDRFPIKFWTQQCSDIFGSKFNEEYVSNVVFVHGSVDPWHMLGITKTINANAPAIFIKGTAHCANMYPASHDDPSDLKSARIQIGKYIQK
ncbi:hypothetical protein YQE_10964, partial [Dendroctonus ponderosae]